MLTVMILIIKIIWEGVYYTALANGKILTALRTSTLSQETDLGNNFKYTNTSNCNPSNAGHKNARRRAVRLHPSNPIIDAADPDMYSFSE